MLEDQFPDPRNREANQAPAQGPGETQPSGNLAPSRNLGGASAAGRGQESALAGAGESRSQYPARQGRRPARRDVPAGGGVPPNGNPAPAASYGYGYGEGYGAHVDAGARVAPSLQDYLNLLKRHLWVVILPTVLGALAGVYLFSISPKQYRSWTSIEVERVKQEAAEVQGQDEKIRLSSFAVIAATVEKLRMPRIYQGVATNHLFFNRRGVLPKQKEYRLPWSRSPGANEGDETGVVSSQVLAAVMPGWISVNWRENTNLIDIYATHTDPEVARDVLQALLVEYEKLTEMTVSGSEEYALDYIMAKSSEVKQGMVATESALNRYNRCLELSKQIREAENTVIQMEKRYLDKWPDLVEARELVTILKARFAQELEQVLASSSGESEFWDQQKEELKELSGDPLISAQLKVVETRASILQKELESDQVIFENLITELKEGEVTKGFSAKQFEVIQPPTLSYNVIAPRLSTTMRSTVGIGLVTGLGIVFLVGLFDRTLRTVSDLESAAEIPVIGAIPDSKGAPRKHQLVMLEGKQASVVEAVRTVRAGLVYLGDQEERRSFLITSSLPGEGKSWLTANLAVSFAQQGDRTLLIDGDLRKGTQSPAFNLDKNLPGLTDVLARKVSPEAAFHPSGVDNLVIVPGGTRSPNPAELLGSRNLAPFLEGLHESFDRIIIDSAPIVPVSDTLPLAKLAQTVLMVFRIGKTPKAALRRSLKVLRANRTEPVGLIANRLPRARGARSQAYYYSYYGGDHYSGYYTSPKG